MGSFLSYILSFYIFYSSGNYWVFLGAFVVFGIGEAFRSGTHKGMIMDYLKLNNESHQKITYYGHTRSWSQKGSALSSLVAGFLVYYSGNYKSVFLLSSIPYFINLLLIYSYPNSLDKPKPQTQINSLSTTLKSFFEVIKQPKVLQLINTTALHSAYLKALKDYIQPLMLHVVLLIPLLMNETLQKKNGIIIGILYFFLFLLTSITSKNASKVSKLNLPYLTLIFGFSFGLLTGLFYQMDLWVMALLSMTGIFIIENLRKPILTGYVANHVPNELLTSVISTQSLLKTIITAVLAFGFGMIADRVSIGIAFISVSSILLVVSLLLRLLSVNKTR